jgi:hypothetical protein
MPATVLVPAKHVQKRLSVSPVTLWRWRESNEGPRWCKLGARVMYDADDVERFVAEKFGESAGQAVAA